MYKQLCLVLGLAGCLVARAQRADSLRQVSLEEVVVQGTHSSIEIRTNAIATDVLRQGYFERHQNGNLVQTIEHLPGIHSMNIGSGFAKPVIRGQGFNRVAVAQDGIKQEGQQWGADHGLEIDAFNVEQVTVLKGPASLLYGSDAMGGVIEIQAPRFRAEDQMFGQADLMVRSINNGLAASLMAGLQRGPWMIQGRYTEQHFGDLRTMADSVVYLTQVMPIYHRRLKNTAGRERDASVRADFRKGRYKAGYSFSSTSQKTGFFAGAHGVPDASRLAQDGSYRNIDLPYSTVTHLKAATSQQLTLGRLIWTSRLAWQLNHREEWSEFHTHYSTQQPPLTNPDMELLFRLHTVSLHSTLRFPHSSTFDETWGVSLQNQHNTIGGYSFLLPSYKRLTAGAFWLFNWQPMQQFSLTGGLRYDHAGIHIDSHRDPHLAAYLTTQGYQPAEVEEYEWVSREVDRSMGNASGSLGFVWTPGHHVLKMNIGRSFRLPGANELAGNGVHHGTFRHEQGDATLGAERGWQADLTWHFTRRQVHIDLSPFASLYSNYIFLNPTGQWSVIPHAGQIYRYTQARALLAGGEVSVELPLGKGFAYRLNADFVYTYNATDHTALPFSPPATMRHAIDFQHRALQASVEVQSIAPQNRVAHNEDATPGATLLHASGSYRFRFRHGSLVLSMQAHNLLGTVYYNHLSFYRKIQIPEAGRTFQLGIKVPFQF